MPTDLELLPLVDPTPQVEMFLSQGGRGVTFDVFDTLIWRETLFPSDAFLLLAEAYGTHHHGLRISMEKLVSYFCRRILRREPTLTDIYRFYPLPAHHELAIEERLCKPNPYCLTLTEYLLNKNVPVAAISDMYLESAQIARLLRHCGYPELPVYSSASIHKTKFRDGRLFHHVWQTLGLSANQVVHVGDNRHADIFMAAAQGARTCHIAAPRDTLASILGGPLPAISEAADSLTWGRLAIDLHCALGRLGGRTPEVTHLAQHRGLAPDALADHLRRWLQECSSATL